jgi:hypothetical protein
MEKNVNVCVEDVCWQHKAEMLRGSKLIHSTTIESMRLIVQSGILYSSDELVRRQIFMKGGEGNIGKRKCCNPYDYPNQSDVPGSCSEACATYFRFLLQGRPIPIPKRGMCILRFSTNILCNEDFEWHFNSEENNGFLISNNVARWGSGEYESRTILKRDIHNIQESDFVKKYPGELVITRSVPTEYLTEVYFGSEEDYEANKDFLKSYDIRAVRF